MRTLVVAAHPSPTSFGAHLKGRVLRGLNAAGHQTRVLDLYAEGFDPAMSAEERALHHAPPEQKPWVAHHAELLGWAEHIVWVYPTWWSGPPAILKGWVDRCWVVGVAYDMPEGAKNVQPGLHHIRRMTVVTTHGSSWWVNRLEGEVGKAMILRGLRALCGVRCRTKALAMFDVDRSTSEQRERFAGKVETWFASH